MTTHIGTAMTIYLKFQMEIPEAKRKFPQHRLTAAAHWLLWGTGKCCCRIMEQRVQMQKYLLLIQPVRIFSCPQEIGCLSIKTVCLKLHVHKPLRPFPDPRSYPWVLIQWEKSNFFSQWITFAKSEKSQNIHYGNKNSVNTEMHSCEWHWDAQLWHTQQTRFTKNIQRSFATNTPLSLLHLCHEFLKPITTASMSRIPWSYDCLWPLGSTARHKS